MAGRTFFVMAQGGPCPAGADIESCTCNLYTYAPQVVPVGSNASPANLADSYNIYSDFLLYRKIPTTTLQAVKSDHSDKPRVPS